MKELLIISSFIALFIKSTDEEKPLNKIFLKCYYIIDNKFLRKAFFECLLCRCFWASIIITIIKMIITNNYLLILDVPLILILSIWFYKIME